MGLKQRLAAVKNGWPLPVKNSPPKKTMCKGIADTVAELDPEDALKNFQLQWEGQSTTILGESQTAKQSLVTALRRALKPLFHVPPNPDVDANLRRIAEGELVREESEDDGSEDLPGNAGEAETPAEREEERDDTESEGERYQGEEQEEEQERGTPLGNLRSSPPPQLLPEQQSVTIPRASRPRGNRRSARGGADRRERQRQNVSSGTQGRQEVAPDAMGQILQAIKGLSEKVNEIDQRTKGAEPGRADPERPGNIDWFSQLPARMGNGDELRGVRPVRQPRANPLRRGVRAERARPIEVLDRRRHGRSRRENRRRGGHRSDSSEEEDSEVGGADNEEFWELFREVPFKTPVLRVDELVGENMLRLALTNHPSVSAYVESIAWKERSRNKYEATKLARMMDFNIGELGIDCVRRMGSTEIAMRRLSALQVAERQGGWTLATHIDESVSGLLTARQQRHMLAAANLEQKMGLLGGGSAGVDDAYKGAVKKKAPGAE